MRQTAFLLQQKVFKSFVLGLFFFVPSFQFYENVRDVGFKKTNKTESPNLF